jgi:hypothetical protein
MPPAFIHINPAIGDEFNLLGFQQRTLHIFTAKSKACGKPAVFKNHSVTRHFTLILVAVQRIS